MLNDDAYPVSKQVKNHVLQTVKQLRYIPNTVAKNLKTNAVQDIGIVIPAITNPFYQQAILGVQGELDQRNYNILLCNSFRDEAKEAQYLRSLYQKQIGGVVISSISQDSKMLTPARSDHF